MDHQSLAATLAAFDSSLPLERAATLPASWYTSPQVAALERRAVFHNSWQVVGRTDQVAEPGQFFTTDIAGEPILVVRDQEGQLAALANVCRHRAAQVECREEGKATRFRCRYHGWAYNLKGRLVGTPDFHGVAEFCKDALALPPYHVDTWGPLVAVHLGTPHASLADWLAPVARRTGAERLGTLRFGGRRVYEMRSNWKLFIDNYLDGGYHIPTLHPDLAKVVDMDGYHTVLEKDASLQVSPLKPTVGARRDETLNAVRTGDAAHYWWLWPNFMINVYEGTMDTNLVLPLAGDRCLCIFDFYFSDVTSGAGRAYIEKSMAIAHQVQLEDQDICEEVQRGLASRSYHTGRFSVRREAGGLHFHQRLARTLRDASAG